MAKSLAKSGEATREEPDSRSETKRSGVEREEPGTSETKRSGVERVSVLVLATDLAT